MPAPKSQPALEAWSDEVSDPLAPLEGTSGLLINGKSLVRRASGRFYTPEPIGRQLARAVAKESAASLPAEEVLTAIDPFCGDGRLVAWLMEEFHAAFGPRAWAVTLWDNDPAAVPSAVERVDSTALRLGCRVSVQSQALDTFAGAGSGETPEFRLVITNPPWELVKPDRRELEHLTDEAARDYVAALRGLDRRLAASYPAAQPVRRFAGWGTNLARVGTEAALRLTARNGVCGVVSPSSLFADTNSEPLRRAMFESAEIRDIAHYPAEARLFEHVDQPCVTFVAVKRPPQGTSSTRLTRFRADGSVADAGVLRRTGAALAEDGYIIPVSFGVVGIELLSRFSQLPRFAEIEARAPGGLWAGRELDETRRQRFLTDQGEFPFVKARNIGRFTVLRPPGEYLNPAVVRVPQSAGHARLAWRDVSRPSQKRRVQATLIPPGWVTGNSLSVAYFRGDNLARLAALLAVMSSIPFEYQLRSTLSTGHVSLASVRRVRLPVLGPGQTVRLAELAQRCLSGSDDDKLEVETAKAYGLELDEMEAMLGAFPALSEDERRVILEAWD